MNLDNLAGMFSQRSGVQQSMSSTIMSTIMNYMMQHFMQKGLGSFMNSGGGDRGPMQSSFSELQGGLTNDPHHPLIQQVKNNCGLQDDNQARMYTQQATGFLSEHANNDPQGLSSLFGSLGGGGLGGLGQQQGGGGGIGDMVGGLLGGGGGSSENQNPNQQQQQKKKGGLGDMLGI
jgi:hypothetical protein